LAGDSGGLSRAGIFRNASILFRGKNFNSLNHQQGEFSRVLFSPIINHLLAS
jgi:hypothetical protein